MNTKCLHCTVYHYQRISADYTIPKAIGHMDKSGGGRNMQFCHP